MAQGDRGDQGSPFLNAAPRDHSTPRCEDRRYAGRGCLAHPSSGFAGTESGRGNLLGGKVGGGERRGVRRDEQGLPPGPDTAACPIVEEALVADDQGHWSERGGDHAGERTGAHVLRGKGGGEPLEKRAEVNHFAERYAADLVVASRLPVADAAARVHDDGEVPEPVRIGVVLDDTGHDRSAEPARQPTDLGPFRR